MDDNGIPTGEFQTEAFQFEIEGVSYTGTPFKFPIDSARTLSAEVYNAAIADPINNALNAIFQGINEQAPINLGLNSLLPDTDPQLISSIDTINISDKDILISNINNRNNLNNEKKLKSLDILFKKIENDN